MQTKEGKHMRKNALASLLCAMAIGSAMAADEAALLLDKAGVRGGLCLVVGANDISLSTALARDSALYVQVLQPDAGLAAQWGAAVAGSTNRDSIGIRHAALDTEHYGSDLFNLIVVEDAATLGVAKLADLNRILAPNGMVAIKEAAEAAVAETKSLGMSYAAAGAYAMCRKPARPAKWKLPLETKWLAGPRSQIANGFKGVCTGGGKLFYIEQMERDNGNLSDSAAVVFARDAYNGRTLWTYELPGGYVRQDRVDLTANVAGRVFAKASTGQVVCLDGSTGKFLFEVTPKANEFARLSMLNDDLLCISGEVRSADDGKLLWKFPSFRYQPLPGTVIGERVFFCDGTGIFARDLKTGAELWKTPVSGLPKPVGSNGLMPAENFLMARMSGGLDEANIALLDANDGRLLWTYDMKVRLEAREKYFDSRRVRVVTTDGKALLYYRRNQLGRYADEFVGTRLDLATGKPEFEDKINKDAGDFHGCFGELQLGEHIAWYDLWVNRNTLETSKPSSPHPACFFGSSHGYGMIFNFPSRKSGPISAVGPADIVLDPATGGKVLQKYGLSPRATEPETADWPCFRANASGGNSVNAAPGKDLVKAWDLQVGTGKTLFGVMSSQRTGLSQAALGYGLAVVADIDGQRIVAVDVSAGEQKWTYHVGSRVDYPPTLHKGLCLFAARDGWVYCLDARTGKPVYRLLAAPRERYIAGREKLESRWPLSSDVLIRDGVAYVGGDGVELTFNPETGEALESKKPGRELILAYDMLLKGNSIPRTNEDNKHGFGRSKFGRNFDARALAFDDALTVAYQFLPAGEGWANKGKLLLKGITADPKKPVWTSGPIELVVADMVLTPQHVYAVGHYQRVKQTPELWVVSREDGKVLNSIPVDGFPAFFGMSAAGNRLFVATREGKLICLEGRK
jgi:outer membrane protein assembly factor BamB